MCQPDNGRRPQGPRRPQGLKALALFWSSKQSSLSASGYAKMASMFHISSQSWQSFLALNVVLCSAGCERQQNSPGLVTCIDYGKVWRGFWLLLSDMDLGGHYWKQQQQSLPLTLCPSGRHAPSSTARPGCSPFGWQNPFLLELLAKAPVSFGCTRFNAKQAKRLWIRYSWAPPSRWNDVDTLTPLMSPKREKGRMFWHILNIQKG